MTFRDVFFGDSSLIVAKIVSILNATIQYIFDTKRFDVFDISNLRNL